MSNLPQDLMYSDSHEWVRNEGGGIFTIGITDHAQHLLGDLVFVELPEVGMSLAIGDECAVVESVKAASDVYSPMSGQVLEVNESLADAPETINDDPYDGGWIFKLKVDDEAELGELMSAEQYQEFVDSEED